MRETAPPHRALAWLYAELPNLVAAGLVTPEGAEGIRQRYGPVRERNVASIALIGLSALGAMFIIGGIILLFGSNWELLSRGARAGLSLLLLIAAQGLVAFTLLRKGDSTAWREAAGLFLTGAIGACIALIGQTYHLPGSMTSFLWVWMLLGWPLIYLLHASTVAVLAMGAALWWGSEVGDGYSVYIWLFLAGLVPHMVLACLRDPGGVRFQFLSWFFVPFLLFAPVAFQVDARPLTYLLCYSLAFAVCMLFGLTPAAGRWFNPWRVIGGIATLSMAITLTFAPAWAGILSEHYYGANRDPITWRIYAGYLIMLALYVPLMLHHARAQRYAAVLWGAFPMVLLLCTSMATPPILLCHLYVLALGILSLREGIQRGRLGLTNLGMMLLALYFFARFIDIEIPFLLRGVLFILVGMAFLAGNVVLGRRMRGHKADHKPREVQA